MADYELIQSRTISGKGVLKLPVDKKKNRAFVLYCDLVRPPKSPYLNLNYNPPRSRYGTISFMREEYVISTANIDYKRQAFDGVNDISGQTLIALKCANNAILQSIYNLSVALAATPGGAGLTPITFVNVIKDYENLRLSWDECRLVCYADTVLQLRLFRIKYDTCNADFDKDKAPPPPPPPKTPVPPGTPLDDLDPPYDFDDSDGGNTQPYPGDSFPGEPAPCITVIRGSGLNLQTCGSIGNYSDYPFNGYGELVPVTMPPNSCPGLRLYLDGVDQGSDLTFYIDAVVLSRSDTCLPPSEGD